VPGWYSFPFESSQISAEMLEDLFRAPVLRLALEPAALLENENAFARGREVPGEGSAAGSAANDDDVVIGFHDFFCGKLKGIVDWRPITCEEGTPP
jgi:hypothetical protein